MNLHDLREIATAASPGPWEHVAFKPYEWSTEQHFIRAPEVVIDNGQGRTYAAQILGEDEYPTLVQDHKFVEKFNPSFVIQMLDRLHYLEEHCQKLESRISDMGWIISPDRMGS